MDFSGYIQKFLSVLKVSVIFIRNSLGRSWVWEGGSLFYSAFARPTLQSYNSKYTLVIESCFFLRLCFISFSSSIFYRTSVKIHFLMPLFIFQQISESSLQCFHFLSSFPSQFCQHLSLLRLWSLDDCVWLSPSIITSYCLGPVEFYSLENDNILPTEN